MEEGETTSQDSSKISNQSAKRKVSPSSVAIDGSLSSTTSFSSLQKQESRRGSPSTDSLSSKDSNEDPLSDLRVRVKKAKEENDIQELLSFGEELSRTISLDQRQTIARDILFPLEEIKRGFYPVADYSMFRNLNTAALIVACAVCDSSPVIYTYLYKIYKTLGNAEDADFDTTVEHLKARAETEKTELDEDSYSYSRIKSNFIKGGSRREAFDVINQNDVPPESSSAYELYAAGLILCEERNYNKAKLFFEKSGEKGCVEAYVDIAEMIANRKIAGDQRMLLKYIKKADKKYVAIGSIAMAKIYLKTPATAIELFERAAKLHDVRGYQNLLSYDLVTEPTKVAEIEAEIDKYNEKRNLILQKIKELM